MESRATQGCGDLLRYWRGVRKMSQLDLAGRAGVSARHISFVESGRAAPSREMLVTLAGALDVPLRERNALFSAAGYAHLYEARTPDAPELQPMMRVLRTIVERASPYPSMALDAQWNVLFTNAPAAALLRLMPGAADAPNLPNLARLVVQPAAVNLLANWDEVAAAFLDRLQREALSDPRSRALLDELRAVSSHALVHKKADLARAPALVVPIVLNVGSEKLSFFSTITTLGTPIDMVLQELRIETYYPSDETTEAFVRAMELGQRLQVPLPAS